MASVVKNITPLEKGTGRERSDQEGQQIFFIITQSVAVYIWR
jgi:hypothetical protein